MRILGTCTDRAATIIAAARLRLARRGGGLYPGGHIGKSRGIVSAEQNT